jgi:hypothetical protein
LLISAKVTLVTCFASNASNILWYISISWWLVEWPGINSDWNLYNSLFSCTLNANKAVGPDIIINRMLVSVNEEISKPFCSLFNQFLREKSISIGLENRPCNPFV